MKFFGFKRRKPPALLKCVVCQRRPGETLHHHIPLCRSCKSSLDKHLHRDGRAILTGLEALRRATDPQTIDSLTTKIIDHASRLTGYEDQKIQTIQPPPTVIMHRVRMGDYHDLVPQLVTGTGTD